MLVCLLGMLISLVFKLYVLLSDYNHVSNAQYSQIFAQRKVLDESEFEFMNQLHMTVNLLMTTSAVYDFFTGAAVMLSGVLPWMWKKICSKKFFDNRPTVNYYIHAGLLYAAWEILQRLLLVPFAILVALFFNAFVNIRLFAFVKLSFEIIGLFVAMGIFSKIGKFFPFVAAAAIPVLHHIMIILIYHVISSSSVPFDFDTPHGKVVRPFLEQQRFPLNRVFLDKAAPVPNVGYNGIWPFSRCIIVFAPILELATPEQFLGVIAHELGHGAHFHQLLHEFYYLAFGTLVALACYHLLFKKNVYEALGFTEQDSESSPSEISLEKKQNVDKPFVPKFILAYLILPWLFAPLYTMIPHVLNATRHFGEYQADRHSMSFGFATHLSDLTLKFAGFSTRLVAHPFYDYVKNTHPALTRRINKLGVYKLYE